MTRAKLRQEWAAVSAMTACLMNENRLPGERIPLDFLVPKFTAGEDARPEPEEIPEDIITDTETKRRVMETLKGRF